MTMVSWDREPGDRIEQIIAACLLLDNPQGNRITPSRGDRGIDVQVEVDGRWDIYQIKKFSRTLTTGQKNQVRDSWDTFISEVLPRKDVRSWTLVMPWDPTNEQKEWFDDLTCGHEFESRWWGLTHVDAMAANRPNVISYYCGDGGRENNQLMARLLQLSSPLPTDSDRPSLLDGLSERMRQIAQTLTQIDPFYKYVVDVRTGDANDWDPEEAQGCVFVQCRQVSEDQYVVTKLFPLSAESSSLRPIGGTLALYAPEDSPEAAAISNFLDYGTPFSNVAGSLSDVTGPEGLVEAGPGFFTAFMLSSDMELHPLELQLMTATNEVLQRLPLTNLKGHGSPSGQGITIEATDFSETMGFRFRSNGRDREIFDFTVGSCVGKSPSDVLPAMNFIALFDGENQVTLALRGGRPVLRPITAKNDQKSHAAQFAAFLEALALVQQYSDTPVGIPDLATVTPKEKESVEVAARLLRGETVTWSREAATLSSEFFNIEDPKFQLGAEITVVSQEPLFTVLNSHRTELAAWMTSTLTGTITHVEPADSEGLVSLSIGSGTVVGKMTPENELRDTDQ